MSGKVDPIDSNDAYDPNDPALESYTQRVKVERPVPFVPQRVVSLVPSVTETLFDLDLGDRLVGVTEYCTRPAEKIAAARLPRVGGTKNPDIRAILALRPDLVIVNREENRKPDADALNEAGITTWVTEPNTVREAVELLWQIMDVFEYAAMTHRVRMIHITYEATRRYMNEETDLPLVKTFVPIWHDPLMTFNQHTYIHDLLFTCGALNVFAERERAFPLAADQGKADPLPPDDPRITGRDIRYPRVTMEEVIAAQPELILLPDEPYPFGEAELEAYSAILAKTPAVKNGHIYLVDGSFLTWHGTRLAYALNDLPPLIARVRGAVEGAE
ncbi:MAG TPA: helical backbone metal receptor [Aggregatilineales bacterium]|nr:ABC transporter substrate-binding protein [Anaerolineales bacterium]HRE46974.1 helical backbone metal receptor [Aggregatilineales bacterium]